jgi:tetratricopeptide (TPR) repeat protein
MQIDPIHVQATGDNETLTIDAYDAAGLFNRAAILLRKGRCEKASDLYRKIAKEFSESKLAPPSLYNSGLCNEQLNRYEQALGEYTHLINNYPDSPDVTDAMFRLVGTYERLEARDEALRVLDLLLHERDDLEGIEMVEALVRKGSNMIEIQRDDEARLVLEEATMLFRTGRGIPPSTSTFYYAMAQFKISEIAHGKMKEAKLPADETQLQLALEDKCQLLLDAQYEYTKTIKIAHPHWAAAAAYRIGNLYHTLWNDMVTTPVPEDLNEEEREIFLDVLKERIRVLLKKAIVQWERTLKMARRLNLSNEWIEQTTRELEEVRAQMTKKTGSQP